VEKGEFAQLNLDKCNMRLLKFIWALNAGVVFDLTEKKITKKEKGKKKFEKTVLGKFPSKMTQFLLHRDILRELRS